MSEFHWQKSRLYLRQAIGIKQSVLEYRDASFGIYKNPSGICACLEIPSLVHYHPHTALEIVKELTPYLTPQFFETTIEQLKARPWQPLRPYGGLELPKTMQGLSAQASFSVECGLLSLAQSLLEKQLLAAETALWLSELSKTPVDYNALVWGAPEQWPAPNFNYQTVKYKLGRQSLDRDLQAIGLLALQYEKLRLDGNKHFSFEALMNLMLALDEETRARIEYVEDPFTEVEDWLRWDHWSQSADELGLPALAVDESFTALPRPLPYCLKVIVLKPSLGAHFADTFELQQHLHETGFRSVITHTFETPIGLQSLKLFAQQQNRYHPMTHGLDGSSYLKRLTPHSQTLDLS